MWHRSCSTAVACASAVHAQARTLMHCRRARTASHRCIRRIVRATMSRLPIHCRSSAVRHVLFRCIRFDSSRRAASASLFAVDCAAVRCCTQNAVLCHAVALTVEISTPQRTDYCEYYCEYVAYSAPAIPHHSVHAPPQRLDLLRGLACRLVLAWPASLLLHTVKSVGFAPHCCGPQRRSEH
jgi:hypothetical protein